MKLILKITLLYLFISLVVFLMGGVITFQVINREVDLEEKRFLRERLNSAVQMLERRNINRPINRDKLSITPLGEGTEETEIVYSDTLVTHATLNRPEMHVKLEVIKSVKGMRYKISMYDLIVEEDDIAEGVQESLLKMYLLLFVVVLVLSGATSYWLLKPFNSTLLKIKDFSLKDDQHITFGKSNTSEFDKLNRFLQDMTTKMKRDYWNMKEFTENASHEMQTPLSIAKGKLEVLMNADNLTDDQRAQLASAQQSLSYLSRMNKSLALLTKIENKEFATVKEVPLSNVVGNLLNNFEELIALKSIHLETSIEENVTITMDPMLCDILLTNLMQNAIRHNVEKGQIIVKLSQGLLQIKNTGKPLQVDPSQLFDRFKKANQSGESLGLGLSIVKKIVDASGFKINYTCKEDWHTLEISF